VSRYFAKRHESFLSGLEETNVNFRFVLNCRTWGFYTLARIVGVVKRTWSFGTRTHQRPPKATFTSVVSYWENGEKPLNARINVL